MIPNEKLNFTPREIGLVIIATAATALCAVIDILLKEDSSSNPQQREEIHKNHENSES